MVSYNLLRIQVVQKNDILISNDFIFKLNLFSSLNLFSLYLYFIEVETNTDFISAFPPKCTVDTNGIIPKCYKKLSIYPDVYVSLNYEENVNLQGKSVCYIKIHMSVIFIPQYYLYLYNLLFLQITGRIMQSSLKLLPTLAM